MKKTSAGQQLPAELIKEIQKYVSGKIIYIPKPYKQHKKWGEVSGAVSRTAQRNEQIRRERKKGCSIAELAGKFYLSESSIKKIIYEKN